MSITRAVKAAALFPELDGEVIAAMVSRSKPNKLHSWAIRFTCFVALSQAAPAAAATAAAETPARESAAALDSILGSSSLGLGQLERAVVVRNPSLAAMEAAWRESEAKADRVGALDDPTLEGMVGPESFGKDSVDPAYSIGLSQHIAPFGQNGLRRNSARAESRAAAEDYRARLQDLVRETRRLYYELYVAARGAEVNRELTDLLGQFRRIAVQKYAAGTAGQQDALQAEVELAMLDHQQVAQERTRRVLVAQIRALLHDQSERPFPDPPRELGSATTLPPADSAAAMAVELRPELRGMTARRDARGVDLDLARRDRLPELTLEARYDRFMDVPEWRTGIGVAFNLPWLWGRTGAGVREAEAGLLRAESERLAEQDRILAEIREARATAEETEHEVHVMETGVVPATERALASVRVAYEANRSDFLALLNAERDLSRARLDLYRAQAEYRISLADYERAIGVTSPNLGALGQGGTP